MRRTQKKTFSSLVCSFPLRFHRISKAKRWVNKKPHRVFPDFFRRSLIFIFLFPKDSLFDARRADYFIQAEAAGTDQDQAQKHDTHLDGM